MTNFSWLLLEGPLLQKVRLYTGTIQIRWRFIAAGYFYASDSDRTLPGSSRWRHDVWWKPRTYCSSTTGLFPKPRVIFTSCL